MASARPSRWNPSYREWRKERKAAHLWWERNRSKLPSMRAGGDDRLSEEDRGRRIIIPAVDVSTLSELPVVYDERHRRIPMASEERAINLASATMSARVRHVLTFMKPAQRDLIWGYYVLDESWRALRRGSESRQSFHERLGWARVAFLRAWVEHAEDEITLREEDF